MSEAEAKTAAAANATNSAEAVAAANDAGTSTTNSPIDKLNLETRLYIGNVNYGTSKQELKDFFSEFEVSKVDIPKKLIRGRVLQLGFAFINLANVEDIEKFIEKYNQATFKDRVITVNKASPPDENKPKAKPTTVKNKKSATAATKTPKKKATASGKENSEEASSSSEKSETEGASAKGSKKEKKTFEKKPKVPLSEGTVSKDTVYITNVDFKLNTEQLTDYLKKETKYDPVWVHVPTQRLPGYLIKTLKKKNVEIRFKSRGYAFIRFNSEEEQQNFIKEFNGTKINDRPITVKAAIDLPSQEELEAADKGEGKEEDATAAPNEEAK